MEEKEIKKYRSLIKIKNEFVFLYFELKKTFSNEPSFFSSKRIERVLFVLTALITFHVWFWKHVNKLTYEEVIACTVMWLGFAGYSMHKSDKEKNSIKNQIDKT